MEESTNNTLVVRFVSFDSPPGARDVSGSSGQDVECVYIFL